MLINRFTATSPPPPQQQQQQQQQQQPATTLTVRTVRTRYLKTAVYILK